MYSYIYIYICITYQDINTREARDKAKQALISYVEARLAAYPTTLTHDTQLLETLKVFLSLSRTP